MGCDREWLFDFAIPEVFQSTHPRGVRPFPPGAASGVPVFQSTHPRGVRRLGAAGSMTAVRFQSTHPRGVRLMGGRGTVKRQWVSIHAPTWGATRAVLERVVPGVKFQSTHPRGVRHRIFGLIAESVGFNPRTHVGCDQQAKQIEAAYKKFQSTHPRGVRLQFAHIDAFGIRFQSTHPRGVRHVALAIYNPQPGFNPRTHVGCDVGLGA